MHQGDRNQLAFLAVIGSLVLAAYFLLSRLYYLYFHPLASFPGPTNAATSRRWIYRITDSGFPEEELEWLHKKHRFVQPILLVFVLLLTQTRNKCSANRPERTAYNRRFKIQGHLQPG